MKKATRLGTFALTFALVLLMIAAQRAYSPLYGSVTSSDIRPDTWWASGQLVLAPQKLQISFSTTNQRRISVYVLDSTALRKWSQTLELSPTIAIENTSSHMGTYDIPTRGVYTILIRNVDKSPTETEVGLTAYSFETDLLITTASLAIIGTVLIATNRLRKPKQKENQN
jgi:hypothetical protein